VFDKLLATFGFEKKASKVFQAMTAFGMDNAVWTPRDYESLARQGYMLNADVYACVNIIARSAKQIPWIVTDEPGGKFLADTHPLVRLLRKPNEFDTESDFKDSAISYFLLSGNTYIERAGGAEDKPPAFLYPHRPDRMKVIKGNRRKVIAGYEYKAGGDPVRFESWEILHLKLFHPLNDWYGFSPIEAAAYTIDTTNEANAMNKKLMQKGYPPGSVTIKGIDYTDTQIAQLRAGLKRAVENGEILLLQDATWSPMGFTPVDSSINESRMYNKRDIAAIYGVPAGMIGDTSTKTYANSREERRSLYTEAVIPALTKLRDGLNSWLAPLYGDGVYIDIDKDTIDALAEDRETQATRVSMLYKNGIITRGEAREELKYESIAEDLDGFINDITAVRPAADPLSVEDGAQPDDATVPADEPRRELTVPVQSRSRQLGPGDEIKAFNLISEEQKDNHWKAVDQRRALWTTRITAEVGDRFRAERNAVVRAFREGGESAAIQAVTKQEDAWNKLYKDQIYLPVAEDFARQTLQSIKSNGFEPHEIKLEASLFTDTVLNWLAINAATRVVGVLDTTKASIRRELSAGVSAGEGIYELARRLTAMYSDFSHVRAETVARTETISASNLGSQTAALGTNLPLEKIWISTMDRRTRDPHLNAHNQKQRITDPYTVMGQRLMFPGDSGLGATADNLINCRCSEAYSISRG
jgi:HK97 family phage portal protein